MAELRKFMKLDNNLFFEFLKSIFPLSILNENFPKNRQTFVSTKLNPFKKNYDRERKTSKTFPEFLAKEFVFIIQDRKSPWKKVLGKKVKEFEGEETSLQQSNEGITVELLNTENNLREKEKEIVLIQSRVLELEEGRHHLQQKIKGMKSGIAHSKKATKLFVIPDTAKTFTKVAIHQFNGFVKKTLLLMV